MTDLLAGAAALGGSLLDGGTFEKVLLVALVLVAILALVLVAWLLVKILVLVGKGLVRAVSGGASRAREHRAHRAAARAEALARVQVGWIEEGRPSLGRAIRDARRMAGEAVPWAVVACGEGIRELERELGVTPAPGAELRFGVSERLVLVDATNATERTLRSLARRLPWRRPFDALVVLAAHGRVPPQAAHRAALLARGAGLDAALHVVVPGGFGDGAARLVELGSGRTGELRSGLESDIARGWLGGAGREGIATAARSFGDELEDGLRALRERAPRCLDLAGIVAGGGRLAAAIAATSDRTATRPRGPLSMQAAAAVLLAGIGLGGAGALTAIRDADRLESVLEMVTGQRVERLVGADLVPDPARTASIARLAIALDEAGGSTWARPAGRWIPGADALRDLASDLLVGYVGRPLGETLERRIEALLAPVSDLETWTGRAARADGLLSAWEALLADAGGADAKALLGAAFAEPSRAWPSGVGAALDETGAARTLERLEVVDRARIREAARRGLLASARAEAKNRYLDGPVLEGARQAADPAASYPERHAALRRTRAALEAPAAAWLVEPEDRLRHTAVLPVLARALGLPIVDGGWVASAEAELSRARRQARDDALRIAGPALGPVLERAGFGTSLRLSSAARAWLEVFERVEAARLGPEVAGAGAGRPDVAGPVTLDTEGIRKAQARIVRLAEVEANVPPSVPPALAAATLARARDRLAAGLEQEIAAALVPLSTMPAHRDRLVPGPELVDAIRTTRRIADWLADHGWPEAERAVRAAAERTVESHLRLGLDALHAKDPIRVDFARRGADRELARERLARSIDSVRNLYRTHAESLLALADGAHGEAARSWRSLGRALEAWERGDARSGIGGLESLLDAYAAAPRETCAAPRLPPAPPGYLGQVVRRARSELEAACRRHGQEELLAARDLVLASFASSLAQSWPWSGDRASPDAPREAVERYVNALAAAPDLSGLDARHAPELEREKALWTIDDEGVACVGFRVEWRARPEEDENVHHLIGIELEGLKRSADGYAWRYGTPMTLRLTLARNSPLRFANGTEGRSITHVERFEGSAALLRWLDTLQRRGWTVRAPLEDDAGRQAELVLSVRVTRHGGAPLDLPVFAALGRDFAGLGV